MKIISVLMALALPASAVAETSGEAFGGSYLCLGKAAGGLAFDKFANDWKGSTFDTTTSKFIVKLTYLNKVQTSTYFNDWKYYEYEIEIKEMGDGLDEFNCEGEDRDNRKIVLLRSGVVQCRLLTRQYEINFERGRYQMYFRGGYMGGPDNRDTPFVEIGNCEKI